MCNSVATHDSTGLAPPTLTAPPSTQHEKPGSIGLRTGSASQTASLDLQPGDVVQICVVRGPSQGKEFELNKPLTTIGRIGGGADIQIDDPLVSRSHCAVEVRRDGILLHDLRSTNGTYLDDYRVSVVRLGLISSFRIGSSFLQLKVESARLA
jgi:Inner membrane component of T3SS, cytoplasmic domain